MRARAARRSPRPAPETEARPLPPPTLPSTGFVRLPVVLQLIPVSKAGWWAGIAAGRFPRGVKLTPRTTAWRVEDIRALIDLLAALER